MNTDVMFSSASDEWETPPELFAELDKEFHFTLDVAASKDNAKCQAYLSKEYSGLMGGWGNGRHVCWMNPPYGRGIIKWMAKAYLESTGGGATVVCLVPARTDTKWWRKYVRDTGAEVRFIDGRLRFGKPTTKHEMQCTSCKAVKWMPDPNKQTAGCCEFWSTGKSKISHNAAPFPSAIVIYRPGNADALPAV